MKKLNLDEVREYVNENINNFHSRRLKGLESLDIEKLLKKNPYLLKAKNLTNIRDLTMDLLSAFLSSSDEEGFGEFLEDLAVFVAKKTSGGHKSTAQGVDLEFINNDIHYVVSVKSGTSWGNSSQQNQLEQDLKTAVARLKQANKKANIQPVLGICYGKTKTSFVRGYMKVVGQSFWYLISENPDLYIEIIDPIGYRAEEHSQILLEKKEKIIDQFTNELSERFSDPSNGKIDWSKLVSYNSGNLSKKISK